ncbi:unnamed protein product [Linum tenue]|uniref:Uncharacterized protein n=1 Tax=Linum tenue TaxID=586396 RepID=A0AAV0ICK7_9ROSI|nr:unnamed protein product [Linum tenue]
MRLRHSDAKFTQSRHDILPDSPIGSNPFTQVAVFCDFKIASMNLVAFANSGALVFLAFISAFILQYKVVPR